jgi:hypothetical protein
VGGTCSTNGRNDTTFLKTERKKPLGRRGGRCENGIRVDVRETGWEIVDWIHLA